MIDNISQFFLQASYSDCLYVASYRNKPLGLVLWISIKFSSDYNVGLFVCFIVCVCVRVMNEWQTQNTEL